MKQPGKLLIAGCFVIFMLLFLMSHLNLEILKDAVSSKGLPTVVVEKKTSRRRHYKDSFTINNSAEINAMIHAEVQELSSLGIKLDIDVEADSNAVNAARPTTRKNPEVVKKPVTTTKRTTVNVSSRSFFVAVRTPEPTALEKLDSIQLALENSTNPLKESSYCKNEVFLLILVVSQPGSFKRREIIRGSWASSYADDHQKLKDKKPFPNAETYPPKNVVKTVFIVGKVEDTKVMEKLREEARLTKDIVFGDVIENYRNLTLKTKLALKWAAYGCKTRFVIKTDDDVFINPVVLVEWLKTTPQESLYTGWCNFNSPVIRNKNHKWYVSYDDYKENRFPGYCLGGGYLMSEDLMLKVVKKSYGRKIFPMEDLYVGLMVKELGVQPRDEKKHFNLVYSGKTVNDCHLNNLFLAHQVLDQNLLAHIKQARSALENC